MSINEKVPQDDGFTSYESMLVSSASSCQHYSVVMVTDASIYISFLFSFFLHLQLTVGGKCCSWNKSVRGTDPDF